MSNELVNRAIAAADAGQAVLTPDLLKAVGEALYGPQTDWVFYLAFDLGVARRTMERWLSGKRPIPFHLVTDLAFLCQSRATHLQKATDRLEALAVPQHGQ